MRVVLCHWRLTANTFLKNDFNCKNLCLCVCACMCVGVRARVCACVRSSFLFFFCECFFVISLEQ